MCQILIDQKFMEIWWLLKYVMGLIKHQDDTSYSCQPFFVMPLVAHSYTSFEIIITLELDFYLIICPFHHNTVLNILLFLNLSIYSIEFLEDLQMHVQVSVFIFSIPRKTSRLLNMNIILLWRQRVVSCRDTFVTFLQ